MFDFREEDLTNSEAPLEGAGNRKRARRRLGAIEATRGSGISKSHAEEQHREEDL